MPDNEKDPFLEFYETAGGQKPARSATDKARVSEDAQLLRGPINEFIQKVNTLVGVVFEQEKAKGTRTDLIVTLVMGGMAFVVANVYHMAVRTLGVTMEEADYRTSFMGMFDTAMRDIEKHKND